MELACRGQPNPFRWTEIEHEPKAGSHSRRGQASTPKAQVLRNCLLTALTRLSKSGPLYFFSWAGKACCQPVLTAVTCGFSERRHQQRIPFNGAAQLQWCFHQCTQPTGWSKPIGMRSLPALSKSASLRYEILHTGGFVRLCTDRGRVYWMLDCLSELPSRARHGKGSSQPAR